MGMLEEGMQILADEFNTHESVDVVVAAGAIEVRVKATKGRIDLTVDDGEGGARIITTDRDYLIQKADLVLAGVATLPERGWRIREALGTGPGGGAVEGYEVLSPGDRLPVWRWADEFKKVLRIHVKQIGQEH